MLDVLTRLKRHAENPPSGPLCRIAFNEATQEIVRLRTYLAEADAMLFRLDRIAPESTAFAFDNDQKLSEAFKQALTRHAARTTEKS